MAKQLVQTVPIPLAVAGVAGLPVESVAGIEEAIGMRLSRPQGLKLGVKFERVLTLQRRIIGPLIGQRHIAAIPGAAPKLGGLVLLFCRPRKCRAAA